MHVHLYDTGNENSFKKADTCKKIIYPAPLGSGGKLPTLTENSA